MAKKEVVTTPGGKKTVAPYSPGIKYGDLLFLSGNVPIDPETGKLVKGDIAAQTRRVMDNLKALLETAGSSMDKVLKTTVFLRNMGDFKSMNEVYASYFTKDLPARSCIEVSNLPVDCLIEIEMIASIE